MDEIIRIKDLTQWFREFNIEVGYISKNLIYRLSDLPNDSKDHFLFERIFKLLLEAQTEIIRLRVERTRSFLREVFGDVYLQN